MKKAKIVLVAIAVFAVVGGALAFKAKKALWTLRCPTVNNGVASCPIVAPYATTGVLTTYVCPGFTGMFTSTVADPLGVTCTSITGPIFTSANP